jgi:HlyD family secretion protein
LQRRPRRAAGLAVLAALGGWWASRPANTSDVPVGAVRRGRFEVTVVEAGTLQALRSHTYGSSIQSNQAKILALVPEGKAVERGELLVLFDATPFEEEIRKAEAALGQARAEAEQARQDLRIQGVVNREEVAQAKLKSDRAALELLDAREGKGSLTEEEAEAEVAAAQRRVAAAATALEDLRPLLAEGFITRQELERAEQASAEAREQLEIARRRRDALLRFARPLELSQAEAGARATRESERQLAAAAGYRLQQREAAIAGAASRIAEAESRLATARAQLGRTEVRAEVPGIVVYRTVFFGSEQRKPQVGDQVWANQPLLTLPDLSRMTVEVRVRETDVHKVAKGQRADVRVDAYPGLRVPARVALVGTLALDDPERRGAKSFPVTLELERADPRMRPGMSARVEIVSEVREDAVSVPIEAVSERGGRLVVHVQGVTGFMEREVVTGPTNADFVVVLQGLEGGERVALRPPPDEVPASRP